MIRIAFVVLFLSSCGNLPITYIQNFSSVNSVVFGFPDYEVTEEIFNDYENSFIKVRFGRGHSGWFASHTQRTSGGSGYAGLVVLANTAENCAAPSLGHGGARHHEQFYCHFQRHILGHHCEFVRTHRRSKNGAGFRL